MKKGDETRNGCLTYPGLPALFQEPQILLLILYAHDTANEEKPDLLPGLGIRHRCTEQRIRSRERVFDLDFVAFACRCRLAV